MTTAEYINILKLQNLVVTKMSALGKLQNKEVAKF